MYVCSFFTDRCLDLILTLHKIFLDNQIILLKVVIRKSIVKMQLNTHNAIVTTSFKFIEI